MFGICVLTDSDVHTLLRTKQNYFIKENQNDKKLIIYSLVS
jgi:hypothetical protein